MTPFTIISSEPLPSHFRRRGSLLSQLYRVLHAAPPEGIGMETLGGLVYADKPLPKNWRCCLSVGMTELRNRGVRVESDRHSFRIGGPLRFDLATTTKRQALTDREIEVMRVMRRFRGVWLPSSDVAAEMTPTRHGRPVDRSQAMNTLVSLMAKGLPVERRIAQSPHILTQFRLPDAA